jgi:hypothetical protein
MKQKKKQIGINHTREGIGRGRQPAGQVNGGQRRGGGERNARNTAGAEEEPQHDHNTKPEQYGVRNVEWELHHHCQQAREQQHGQKAEGESGMQTRNGNLVIADLVGSTRHARHLGTLSWTCLSRSEAVGVKRSLCRHCHAP